MPAEDRRGLDDGERVLPSGPPAAQGKPEDAVSNADAGPRVLPLEDGELLAEREVLDHEVGASGDDGGDGSADGEEAIEHPRTMTAAGAGGNRADP